MCFSVLTESGRCQQATGSRRDQMIRQEKRLSQPRRRSGSSTMTGIPFIWSNQTPGLDGYVSSPFRLRRRRRHHQMDADRGQASRSIGQLMQRGPPRPRPSSPPGTVITSMPLSCKYALVVTFRS
jgi:hypothetical protein